MKKMVTGYFFALKSLVDYFTTSSIQMHFRIEWVSICQVWWGVGELHDSSIRTRAYDTFLYLGPFSRNIFYHLGLFPKDVTLPEDLIYNIEINEKCFSGFIRSYLTIEKLPFVPLMTHRNFAPLSLTHGKADFKKIFD